MVVLQLHTVPTLQSDHQRGLGPPAGLLVGGNSPHVEKKPTAALQALVLGGPDQSSLSTEAEGLCVFQCSVLSIS